MDYDETQDHFQELARPILALPSSTGPFVTLIGTADGNLHAVDSSFRKIWTSSSGEPLVSSRHRARQRVSDNEKRSDNQHGREGISSVIPTLDGGLLYSGPEGMRKTSVTARVLTESAPFISTDGLLFTG
eukprot:gene49633-60761_t